MALALRLLARWVMDTTTQSTTGTNNNQLLVLIIPNLVQGDQATMGKVTQAFDGVGTLQTITHGVYALTTDKSVTSWADQVKSHFGTQMPYYIIPVDRNALNQLRSYVPDQIRAMAGASVRAA